MNLIWRFLYTILFSRFEPKVDFFDTCSITMHVLPTDIDVLWHMNNGRYFSLLDLARINFMVRNGVFATLKQEKIFPVVASEMIRFKKSIKLFQRFQITTQIAGWDTKFFYIIHYFKMGDEVCALSVVKAMLRHGNTFVSPEEALSLMNRPTISPTLPSWINDWVEADKEFYTTVE